VVKQAPPDGHTLFQAQCGDPRGQRIALRDAAYDPIKDFRPITLMLETDFPQLLAVPLDMPAKSVLRPGRARQILDRS